MKIKERGQETKAKRGKNENKKLGSKEEAKRIHQDFLNQNARIIESIRGVITATGSILWKGDFPCMLEGHMNVILRDTWMLF